jgi:outer membrane protein TolC
MANLEVSPMKRSHFAAFAATAALLAGCAAPDIELAVQETNRRASDFTGGQLELGQSEQQRQARERLAQQFLAQPLGMEDAVRLALANSPALQALIAQSWSDMAAANQGGRIANPVFTFERLREGHEAEIGRILSFGLLDLLTLPRRLEIARNQEQQASTQLTINVVDQISQVRAAWVRAVAAQQSLIYAQQVRQTAEAGAELARRMQLAGNFTKLQRARQQAFYADATTQLAAAQQVAVGTREELGRALGLNQQQFALLKLPERLPDLPNAPRAPVDVSAAAMQQRLDLQLARLQLDIAGKAQGLNLLNSLIDMELGIRHDTVLPDGPSGSRDTHDGYEFAIRLPIFDWGGAQRAAMNAQSLAAANRYDSTARAASSHLRQSYSGYRTAYDVAKHYRDEVVPLRKTISDENVLRYSGMLIGVFELLADTRDQIATVAAAINAQQQFWLADAGLSSTLIGKPVALLASPVSTTTASGGDAAGH